MSEEPRVPADARDGWSVWRLDEVVTIEDGRRVPLNSDERSSRRGPYPYYGANGQVDSIDDYRYEGVHILVAEDGGYFDQPERGVAYLADGRFWVNNHAHVLKPKPNFEPTFVRDALNLVPWMDYVSGTTRLKLTQAALRKVRLPAPPLDEQRRIVAKLDALRARSRRAKDALDAVPALLDRLRQSILAAAFRGDLTASFREQNPDVEPASELLKRIRIERRKRWEEAELAKLIAKGKPPKDDRWKEKYVEPDPVDEEGLPDLPEGWCWAALGSLADGFGFPNHLQGERSGDLPFAKVGDISRNGIADGSTIDSADNYISREAARSIKAWPVPEGSVLFAKIGEAIALNRRTLAGREMLIDNNAMALVPLAIDSSFLMLFMHSLDLYPLAAATTVPSLRKSEIEGIPVPVPPPAERAELTRRAWQALRRVTQLRRAMASASTALVALDAGVLVAALADHSPPNLLA